MHRMPASHPSNRASLLLVDECFAQADAGFLDALDQVHNAPWLASFADRWKQDPRPWARQQIFAYLGRPLARPGHQPLVKRLFKHAEANHDHELMAAFLVALDVIVRRVRRQHWRWDRATRTSYTEEALSLPRDVIPLKPEAISTHPKSGELLVIGTSGQRVRNGRLFSHKTRQYLRRRAWRYFRWLGYGKPADYPAAVVQALRLYTDADLAKGEHILDSRSLLQICFYGCDAIEFGRRHVQLKPDHNLTELKAAPRFPEAWADNTSAALLFDLVPTARSRLVRMWAIDLLAQIRPRLTVPFQPDPEKILALLDHEEEEVVQFGAAQFETLTGLEKLPLSTWLKLLDTRSLTALATLGAAFLRHVSPERLSLEQIIRLALAQPVPVARLGRDLLSTRQLTDADLPALADLADARCPSLAGELATWALSRIGTAGHYSADTASRFFDSLQSATRDAAWAWLLTPSAGYDDPVLWSRLSETPFEDLRLKLVDHLAERTGHSRLGADALAPIWCAVLLGVHRGGRQKLKAVRDIAETVSREPDRADSLLPILRVAVRSVRGPEMRAGLAAVMTLLDRQPQLAGAVRNALPELQFQPREASA